MLAVQGGGRSAVLLPGAGRAQPLLSVCLACTWIPCVLCGSGRVMPMPLRAVGQS